MRIKSIKHLGIGARSNFRINQNTVLHYTGVTLKKHGRPVPIYECLEIVYDRPVFDDRINKSKVRLIENWLRVDNFLNQ